MIVVRDAGALAVQVIGISVRDDTNSLVDLVGGAARDADGTLKDFFGALGSGLPGEAGAITLDESMVYGFRNSSDTVAITTSSVTVSVAGASGTPTYAWEVEDAGGATWTIIGATTATARFGTNVGPAVEYTGTFRCLVTVDGQSAYSPSVTANVSNYGGTL